MERNRNTAGVTPLVRPAFIIRLEVQARPVLSIDAMSEGELSRLMDWVDPQESLRDLLQRAVSLAEAV